MKILDTFRDKKISELTTIKELKIFKKFLNVKLCVTIPIFI